MTPAGGLADARMGMSGGACALAAVATGTSSASRALADGGAAPLFLAPRAADDISLNDSTDVQRASRQRSHRARRRGQQSKLEVEALSPGSQAGSGQFRIEINHDERDCRQSGALSNRPRPKSAKRANKIAVDAETGNDTAPARRTPARASRSRFREEILQVQQREAADPFSEPLDGPDDMPNSIPDDSTSPEPTPAPGRGQPESGAPQPINPSDDPFPEETRCRCRLPAEATSASRRRNRPK